MAHDTLSLVLNIRGFMPHEDEDQLDASFAESCKGSPLSLDEAKAYPGQLYLTGELTVNNIKNDFYIDLVSIIASAIDSYVPTNRKWTKNHGKHAAHPWHVFTPFSCGCGVAGCAGIHDGIAVRPRKHTIEWRLPKDMGYEFLGKNFFSFDRAHYMDVLGNLRTRIAQMEQYTGKTIFIDTSIHNPLEGVTLRDM